MSSPPHMRQYCEGMSYTLHLQTLTMILVQEAMNLLVDLEVKNERI
jgi:hypothetical protein